MINFEPITEQLGVGGAVGLGFAWMLLKFKPWKNTNGNGRDVRQEAVAAGMLIQKVEQLERTVGDLVPVVTKIETGLAVLANNVQNLTIEVARKVGQ